MINIRDDIFLDLLTDGLKGNKDSLKMRIRVLIRKVKSSSPELAKKLDELLVKNISVTPLRGLSSNKPPVPVDADSRQKLLVENYPVVLETKPLWTDNIETSLKRIILEWEKREDLVKNGLSPSKSLLMEGPPGVGKTLAAKWLAQNLNLPLLTLDLANVMSSFLGKTGSNIKAVLDYARSFPCVLLLDEFDSIAKKRDDYSDVGELKRLVTVLLQAIDDWPTTSILVAATNHCELLDLAVWRRFDQIIHFDLPSKELINEYLLFHDIPAYISNSIGDKFVGQSFAVVERSINHAKRNAVLEGISIYRGLLKELNLDGDLEYIVLNMNADGFSQRQIAKELKITRVNVSKIIQNSKE